MIALLLLGCAKCAIDANQQTYRGHTYAWWWNQTDHELLYDTTNIFATQEMVEATLEGTGAEVICGEPDGVGPCWRIRAPKEAKCIFDAIEEVGDVARRRGSELYGELVVIERPVHDSVCGSCANDDPLTDPDVSL